MEDTVSLLSQKSNLNNIMSYWQLFGRYSSLFKIRTLLEASSDI